MKKWEWTKNNCIDAESFNYRYYTSTCSFYLLFPCVGDVMTASQHVGWQFLLDLITMLSPAHRVLTVILCLCLDTKHSLTCSAFPVLFILSWTACYLLLISARLVHLSLNASFYCVPYRLLFPLPPKWNEFRWAPSKTRSGWQCCQNVRLILRVACVRFPVRPRLFYIEGKKNKSLPVHFTTMESFDAQSESK